MELNKKPIIKTRKVAVLLADGYNHQELTQLKEALMAEGAEVKVIAKYLGMVKSEDGKETEADKSHVTTGSIMFDAVYVPGGKAHVEELRKQGATLHFLNETFKHCKPIAASGNAVDLLAMADLVGVELSGQQDGSLKQGSGVVTQHTGSDLKDFAKAFIKAIGEHRHWDREMKDQVPA